MTTSVLIAFVLFLVALVLLFTALVRLRGEMRAMQNRYEGKMSRLLSDHLDYSQRLLDVSNLQLQQARLLGQLAGVDDGPEETRG